MCTKLGQEKTMARRGRKKTTGSNGAERPYDVLGLRKAVGALYGRKLASRGVLAKLLDAAEGSILNWEHGKIPGKKYQAKLADVERQAAAGTLVVPIPRKGGRPRKNAAPARIAPARAGRAASISSILGEVPRVYANHVTIEQGSHDARVRFNLVLPGELAARAVADVIVPCELLSTLGR
jgi:hypothetical protein